MIGLVGYENDGRSGTLKPTWTSGLSTPSDHAIRPAAIVMEPIICFLGWKVLEVGVVNDTAPHKLTCPFYHMLFLSAYHLGWVSRLKTNMPCLIGKCLSAGLTGRPQIVRLLLYY